MPSWSIHLTVAKRVNEKLKLDDDLFYYGNLIPDVDKESKISRYNAHYYDDISYPKCPRENMINMDKFLKDYRNKLNNPMILGYYCHLLTDTYYNSIVYSNYWVQDSEKNIIGIKLKNGSVKKIDINDKKKLKRKYKHRDFELYGKYLFNKEKLKVVLNKEVVLKNINELKLEFLTEKLVNQRILYLQTDFCKFNKLSLYEKILKHKYKLFTKEELDKMLDNCVDFVIEEINKL